MTSYYVATTGSNSNNGLTTATAWLTIQKAGSAGAIPASGSIINVLDGVYSVSTMATSKAGLTYKSVNRWGAQIVGHQTSTLSICWTDTGNGNTFDGFDISTTGRLGLFADGDDAEVMNCYVHDIQAIGSIGGSGGSGICTNNGPRMQVHHNLVARVETTRLQTGVQGIYPANVSCTIYNNIVVDISQYGIHQWHGASESDFYNNLVINCRDGCFLIGGDSTGPGGLSSNNNIYNNICGFSTYGIREYAEPSTAVTHTTMRSNMIFGCTVPVSIVAAGSTESGRISTTTANARFVAYATDGTGDYHLSAGSPAIGAANSSFVPANDFDYNARPVSATYDIGPYEYGGAGDLTAPVLTLPTGTATGQNTANINITTDSGEGRLWGIATTNTTEISATIITTAEANGTYYDLVATGFKTFFPTGLNAGTTYYAHFMQRDDALNYSIISNSSAFVTDAAGSGINYPALGGSVRRILHRG